MIINRGVENIEVRCENDFNYFIQKYPTVAFNTSNWVSGNNSRNHGKNILFATEGYITIPQNYDPTYIKHYDVFITSNAKFKRLHPELNIRLINGVTNWVDYFWLESFIPYEDKIKGVCSLQTIYHTGSEGDINYLKHDVMCGLKTEPDLILHTYSKTTPFGKPESRQPVLEFHQSHYENLKKINEYLFCWCPESTYHKLWSYGHVTERLFNCFKAKTIAIYYGCYNIEDLVPKELFIDFRDFKNDLEGLSAFLIDLAKDKERYNSIVESAYKWNLTNKIGDIRKVEEVLQDCVKKYKF